MKHKLLLVGLFCPSLLLAANVCTLATGGPGLGNTFYGTTNCGNGSISSITVVGDLNLSGTSINQVTVNGDLDASNATVSTVTIIGDLNGEDSTFGTITATGVVALDSSSAQNIVINGHPGLGAYAVYLGDHAEVGNITFSEGGGVVYVSNSAQIQGTVSGASVQNSGNGSSIGGPVVNP